MTFSTIERAIEHCSPAAGQMARRTLGWRAARGMVQIVNALQMALAESYIHGIVLPDKVLRAIFRTYMPVLFERFPSLLAPYEWVLQETDHLAEGSAELMSVQYDRPQSMLNRMLGDGKLIYPKVQHGTVAKGRRQSRAGSNAYD